MKTYRYKVMFTWIGKLGNRYEYVNAVNNSEAKKMVETMYKGAVKVHWASRED